MGKRQKILLERNTGWWSDCRWAEGKAKVGEAVPKVARRRIDFVEKDAPLPPPAPKQLVAASTTAKTEAARTAGTK